MAQAIAAQKKVAADAPLPSSAGAAAPLPPKDTQGRRNILFTPANLHQTATRAEDALVRAGAPIYTHGSDLKRPVIGAPVR